MADPYKNSNAEEGHKKPLPKLAKEDFYCKLSQPHPADEEVEKTNIFIKLLKLGKEKDQPNFTLKQMLFS